MRVRCSCNTNHAYPYYGGRGIRVCTRWNKFSNFLADMGECPAGKTLGRKDNDGNYTLENCRWETHAQQGRNKRSTVRVKYKGKLWVLADILDKLDTPYQTYYNWRRKYGDTAQQAFERTLNRRRF